MKFLHAADLHLDSPLRGLERHGDDTPNDAIRGASRRAFDALVRLAIDEQVSFVLVAGDLYDGTWRDVGSASFLAKKLGELERAGIRVFAVLGNHDAESRLLDAIERRSNLTVFPSDAPRTERLEALGVALHGQSFGAREVMENLAAGYPARVEGMLNVGLLHTSLDGRPGHQPYAPCTLADLEARGYDYWALGHVHGREIVRAGDPWVVFPGCLQGRHAREVGPKGATLVTVEHGRVERVEERVLDVVRWARCDVDVGGLEDLGDVISAGLEAIARAVEEARDAGRPELLAGRLRFVGRTKLDAALRADPLRLRARILDDVAARFPDRAWVEKVELATEPWVDRASLLAGEGPLPELLRSIGAITSLDEARARIGPFDEWLAPLAKQLAKSAGGLELIDPRSPETLERALLAARELLLDRLVDPEGEP